MTWTLVQKSSAAGTNSDGSTAAPSMPGGSAAGNLLIAVLTDVDEADTITGTAGWEKITPGTNAFAGQANIWYYPDNPGGISNATFSSASENLADSWMAEFTMAGVATAAVAAEGTGSATGASSCAASCAESSGAGDLGICTFITTTSGGTWTGPSGWTLIGDDAGDLGTAWSGYLLSAGAGTLSATAATNLTGEWAGAVATFSAGALSVAGGTLLSFSI